MAAAAAAAAAAAVAATAVAAATAAAAGAIYRYIEMSGVAPRRQPGGPEKACGGYH